MTAIAALGHVANFLAPALVVAVMLSLMPRLRLSRARWRGFFRDTLWLSLAGGTVLLAGLIWFDRDGKMATYAALVVVQGSLAWYLRRS
ncbi:MAG: hypothetical protein ACLGG8_08435 [Gammaproteobacteria bacterium]